MRADEVGVDCRRGSAQRSEVPNVRRAHPVFVAAVRAVAHFIATPDEPHLAVRMLQAIDHPPVPGRDLAGGKNGVPVPRVGGRGPLRGSHPVYPAVAHGDPAMVPALERGPVGGWVPEWAVLWMCIGCSSS